MFDRFKFRAYLLELDKIVDVSVINIKTEYIIVKLDSHSAEISVNFDKCILMQCTGLRDKNNVLIYEKDLVKTSDGQIYEIKKYFIGFNPDECEVIGNRFNTI